MNGSAKSTYEYGKYIEGETTSAEEDPLFYSNYHLPDFELRKDLLRLTESTKAEKVRILERLVSFPRVFQLNYTKIAQAYITDPGTFVRLNEAWEAWRQKKGALYLKPPHNRVKPPDSRDSAFGG